MNSEQRVRQIGWIVMCVLVLILCLYSAAYFIPGMPFSFRPEVYPESVLTIFLISHIAAAIIAALAGPLQFWGEFRKKRAKAHRCLGWLYLLGVAIAAPSALIIAPISQGGLTTHIGFSLLAICWGASTLIAYYQIVNGNWQSHRQWMIRSYALTLAFVPLRLWLGGLTALGADFAEAYQTVAWLCWVPNLVIAELYLAKMATKQNVDTPLVYTNQY